MYPYNENTTINKSLGIIQRRRKHTQLPTSNIVNQTPATLVTSCDTQLTNAVAWWQNNNVQTRHIYNLVRHTSRQHPLQIPITSMQPCQAVQYTTLITDDINYNYHDSLILPIPSSVNEMHICLRNWYAKTPFFASLKTKLPIITTLYTPLQQDGRSCALHIRLVSLSAIYQGTIPILPYNQWHAAQLSKLHRLRYGITGEFTPLTDKLLTYLTYPINNEDPEPRSKHYSARCIELHSQYICHLRL